MFWPFLAQTQASVPATPEWGAPVAAVMILFNLAGLALVRFAVPIPAQGQGPAPQPVAFGFSLPQILAGASIGHVLGTGAILGLANVGAL
ncbi:MAG: photosystem I reaction center subunit PsaK [Cyanobacteria bacterium QS_8_64_29]|nr:MAG: photosystem I reaction center subunit PsaK [Cyanobacteria bacterium QS_8_64_29]